MRLWGLVLISAAVLGCGSGAAMDELEPITQLGGDFELLGAEGRPFALGADRSRLTLLFFGYSSCPEACPMALGRASRATRLLAERGLEDVVRVVYVSVDPERDTPEIAQSYVDAFGVVGVGVTGALPDLERIARAYGAFFEKVESDSALGYLVDHSTTLYLLDHDLVVRRLIRSDDSPEAIAGWIERLATS